MALHRDIFWVGRQWAVTGYGIQAVDQKLQGKFDIEITRLWEDGLSESLDAGEWLNGHDFARALAVARARYPQQLQQASPQEPLHKPAPPAPALESLADIGRAEPAKPPAPPFNMRVAGWPAKFTSQWRVQIR